MFSIVRFVLLALFVLCTLPVLSAELPQLSQGHDGVLHGGNILTSKANRDSMYLIGPWGTGAQANGQFQDVSGSPDWNQWTHCDLTQVLENNWNISNYYAGNLNSTENNLAMYCGDESFPACSESDVDGGYGNSWNDILQFNYTVVSSTEPCDVTISGVYNNNTEPGYDYTVFRFRTAGGAVAMANIDGVETAVHFSYSMSYDPEDYLGDNQDQVRFEIVVDSDGGWSDEDCLYSGNGACQFDDLLVECSNGNYNSLTDFQNGMGSDWIREFPIGFGDFAQIWMGLEDLDPCHSNYSPQVAFIDDGTFYPGVGPSHCINWCYGPGGYIVNLSGGASDGSVYNSTLINNALESPILDLPGGDYIGTRLSFDVFRHEDLGTDSPGIFYVWSVRSAVDPQDLDAAHWLDRHFVYYGGPDYHRVDEVVTDLIEPGATVAQVQLRCWDMPTWSWFGEDGYPAPYFDNVRLVISTDTGPVLVSRELDLAQDNFPELGHIDMDNLAGMNVRFDSALNKGDNHANVPGDSIICNVSSQRVGGALVENRLHYTVHRNPVFDSVRDPAWDVSGFVDGRSALDYNGNPVPDKFAYDLPDSGFLFPGDVLHYYFTATDEVAQSDQITSTLPMDLSGFGDFSDPLAFNLSFQMRCLPNVNIAGSHPQILLWNDFFFDEGADKWFNALNNLHYDLGVDYDYYYTNAPSSGVGNGLGGRANADLLSGYEVLLYTSGDLRSYTIGNGDATMDPSPDVQVLTGWFEQGPVNAFFCGDGLVSNLNSSGSESITFLDDFFNVIWETENIRPLIHNQVTPMVLAVEGNSVFDNETSWIAYGGCLNINFFDGVVPGSGAERLARFTDPSGNPDYSLSAATLNLVNDDRVISLPTDFSFIYTNPGQNPNQMSGREQVLFHVLRYFGFGIVGGTEVPEAEIFSAGNYPNPFNPSTRISFNLPRGGHFGLKIFNVRGELVKTLIDENRNAGEGFVNWDGRNYQGSTVSSGIYFYEARIHGDVKVGKMTLLK